MTTPGTAVVVLSGGMDSATALALYASKGHRIVAVSINYGQRHVRELTAAAQLAAWYGAEHVVVDLSGLAAVLPGSALTDPAVPVPEGHYAQASMRATIVPNRNALLADVAVALAVARGAQVVVMGMHAGDHAVYPDCRPEFITALQQLVDIANEGQDPPRIAAPFLGTDKTGIARIAAQLQVPLHLSWSCYVGGAVHCGRCGTCTERREAFTDAGLPDPTVYDGNSDRQPVGA